MKKIRILKNVLKKTNADKIIAGFFVYVFITAGLILMFEPEIGSYGDALWYCYAVVTTVGFGDLQAVTFPGRFFSVLLSIYSVFVLAIATGVVVSYYGHTVKMQYQDSAEAILDKLDRLSELSKEELDELSSRIRRKS